MPADIARVRARERGPPRTVALPPPGTCAILRAMSRRCTKILATLGPATAAGAGIEMLIAAGVDGVRINCSQGLPKEWRDSVARVCAAAEGVNRKVAVVFDLQGPKIRLAADTRRRRVLLGDEVQLVAGAETPRGSRLIALRHVPGSSRRGA